MSLHPMGTLIQKTRKMLAGFIRPEHKVLIAVSGGIDSSVLLDVMLRLSEELHFKIAVAHFNHQARGEESQADEDFVSQRADSLGLAFITEKGDVFSEAKKIKKSFQETARILRGEFLRRSLLKAQAHFIALGHNDDDQAETVLINLLRGSGMKGLGGMSERSDPFIRPLLNCERSEIQEYAAVRQIDFREDSSNRKADYLRNRIRMQLIPILEDYNPKIKKTLTQTAQILRDEEKLLSLQDNEQLKKIILNDEEKLISMDLNLFWTLSNEGQQRLCWSLLRKIYGGTSRFSYRHVCQIKRIMQKRTSAGPALLPEDWYLETQGKIGHLRKGVFLRANGADAGTLEGNDTVAIEIPGTTSWITAGIEIRAQLLSICDASPNKNADEAFLDFGVTGNQITGRMNEPGDRFVPMGMSGSQKLKKFL